ncbi:MAG: hypothetical protein K1X95_16390, partial [Acidimicrobiia bacterium]|nr:hypothetical protein [Acidimicrobiia bacterium]
MTAPALTERFAGERTGRHLAGLVVVAVVIVSVAAAARTPVAARVFADWLAAALPAAGFAVAGAVVGHLWRSHPLLARTPESVLTLSATAEWVRPGIADRVAGLYAAAVVSPVVVAAAVVAFEGDDRPILVCAWLLTALCAAAGATWSVAPVFGRGADRATAPVGHVRTGGTTLVAGETLDPIAPVVIALRAAALGTGVAALASGVLPDAAVAWMSGRPAAAAAYAIVIAL